MLALATFKTRLFPLIVTLLGKSAAPAAAELTNSAVKVVSTLGLLTQYLKRLFMLVVP